MSRRIVAAFIVVFACGCGSAPPPATSKASSTPATSTVSTDSKGEIKSEEPVKKSKRSKTSSSTTKKAASAAPLNVPADVAAKTETPAVEAAPATAVAKEAAPANEAPATVAIPASFSKSVTLSVPDMKCEFACAPRVKKTLETVAGVAGFKADIENHTVSFLVDPAKYDEAKALEALASAKYPATVKVADAK